MGEVFWINDLKTPPYYNKMLVYKIVCNLTNEIYVGSTTDYTNRQRQHINPSNVCISKQIISRGDYYFEVIEELVKTTTTHELLLRENHWIITLQSINKVLPILTNEQRIQHRIIRDKQNKIKTREWYEKNRERCLENVNKYRIENSDKIRVKKTETKLCDCGQTYQHNNKARHLKSVRHINNTNK